MAGNSYLYQILQGDLVEDAETAVDLAAVLIRRKWGDDTLNEQQPLVAREDGDAWWVEGAPRKSEASPGALSVRMQMKKKDASVALLHWLPPGAPDRAAKR